MESIVLKSNSVDSKGTVYTPKALKRAVVAFRKQNLVIGVDLGSGDDCSVVARISIAPKVLAKEIMVNGTVNDFDVESIDIVHHGQ